MSLFGGDSPRSSESSFSISPIPSGDGQDNHFVQDGQQQAQQDPFDGGSSPQYSLSSDEETSHISGRTTSQEESTSRDRFAGSDALWKSYVRDELLLAKSLLDLRGDDLAAHLYNAHAWKQSLRTPEACTEAGLFARKSKWIPDDNAHPRPWYPEDIWTNWPLEPEAVPGPSEKLWKNTLKSGETKPLPELFDELSAVALSHIRRQWSRRSPEADDRTVRRPSVNRDRATSADSAPKHPNLHGEDSQPVFSADDSRSQALLRPTVMSTIARFDKLLMALHHNRANHYANAEDDTASRLRVSSLSRSRSRSTARTISRRRSSDNVILHSDLEVDAAERPAKRRRTSDDRNTPVDARGRSYQRRRSRSSSMSNMSELEGDATRHHPTARDWSEVVGLAALIGFDPTVVKRTMERCTDLFKESMIMTTNDDSEDSVRPPLGESSEHAEKTSSEGSMYFCPEGGCPRHDKGYPLSKGYRFREHLQRSHDYSSDEVRDLEIWASAPPARIARIRKNTRGWVPPDPLSCPFLNCRQASRIFPEPRRLLEHLTRTHKYDPRNSSPPPELQEHVLIPDSSTVCADFIVDGTHNDGFLQPV